MRTVILVPRRSDGGHRDELWRYCKARWQQLFPELELFEGHHLDGPFNRSAAVNRAAAAAGSWDLAVIIDSDVIIKRAQVTAAIRVSAASGRVTWAHRRWRGFHKDVMDRFLADAPDLGPDLERQDMDLLVERTNPISWSCCTVVPRAVWDDLGGFDERFRGWGWEDMAFQSVVVGLYGHERIEGDVYHLWHPRSAERIVKGLSRNTASPEYVMNARLGRRYMVALRRDHGKTDRTIPASPEELRRDIANLVADDGKYAQAARKYGFPDWTDWWPTLEELRDGARRHRSGERPEIHEPAPAVTVIVHSGGSEEAWRERRGYLEQSLASLTDQLHGPIVQRVLFSDWPPGPIQFELDELAERYGFYVAGGGHYGYSRSMARMWSYLDRRAVGQFVFQAEDDFVYDRPVELGPMIATLQDNPHLRQLALLRQPFYARELEAGSIIDEHPEAYEVVEQNGHSRIEHRLYFTANPSLFRKTLTRLPWPSASSSERGYTNLLNRDPSSRFAYWGDGTPSIRHIGAVKAGDPATY